MRRLALIGLREFHAYAGTASFWLALASGPLLILLGALLLGQVNHKPSPRLIAIEAPAQADLHTASSALAEAAALEGRQVRITAVRGQAQTVLHIARGDAQDPVEVSTEGAPLSAVSWALLRRDLAAGGGPRAALQSSPKVGDPAAAAEGGLGRFFVVLLLWMNLVGSLGMLLQAIVRERANRALELLLTSARPLEIVLGKLAGVAALSLVALATWMAAGALVAGGLGAAKLPLARSLAPLLDPGSLALTLAIYVLAFGLYGGAILGLSAVARDLPAAQNASRPVFGLLLIAFFAAAGTMFDPGRLAWLIWIPPLTPFALLMQDAGALGALRVGGALALLAASTAVVFAAVGAAVSTRRRWRGPTLFHARS